MGLRYLMWMSGQATHGSPGFQAQWTGPAELVPSWLTGRRGLPAQAGCIAPGHVGEGRRDRQSGQVSTQVWEDKVDTLERIGVAQEVFGGMQMIRSQRGKVNSATGEWTLQVWRCVPGERSCANEWTMKSLIGWSFGVATYQELHDAAGQR